MKLKQTLSSNIGTYLKARFFSNPCSPGKAAALVAVATLCLGLSASAASAVWNHTAGGRNWSSAGNWTGGTPSTGNDIFFNNTDAQTTNTPVNVVDASYTVNSLSYTNSYTSSAAFLSFQNTAIASGQTLTSANGLTVGVGNTAGYAADAYTYASIIGVGGVLNVTGGNVQVGYQSSASATYFPHALLDLRGLDSFNYSNSAGTFGIAAQGVRRQGGEVFLAGTNSLTASAITLGYGVTGVGSNPGLLHLGASNNLFADIITIGRMTAGNVVDFQTGLTGPLVNIRAKDGLSVVNNMYVGWNSATSIDNASATNDFSSGIVNAAINNLYLGYFTTVPNAAKSADGRFVLGTNSHNALVVQNLYLGNVTSSSAANANSTGLFEMGGGAATVGTVTLGRQAAGTAKGTLNLKGGTMTVSGDIVAGAGSSTGIVANATLNVAGLIGTSAQYLTALTLSNGTLGLKLLGGSNPSAFVSNFTVDAPSTVSFTVDAPALGRFPLIACSGSVGGLVGLPGLSLVKPPGVAATLADNPANQTVDVVITGVPNKLAFTTDPQALTAGVTFGSITVQLQDLNGTPQNAASDLTVNLSSTSGGGVFRNIGDSTTITSVTIPAGNNSASFKYIDTVAPATPTLTASTTIGITFATQVESINPAAPTKLGFTTQPVNGSLNVTMAPVVVQVQDPFGNPVSQSGTAITLTLNNGGSSVLTGTNPQTTDANGAATFNDLMVTTAFGTNLSLAATGGSLSQATSSNFDISRRIIVKANNNTALNLAGSWSGGVVPGSEDIAQISTTSVGTSSHTPDVGDNASWYGLRIVGWSASVGYEVGDATGGHVITLGAGGLVGSDLTHSTTFTSGFALGTNQTWSWGTGSAPSLNLLGNIDNGGYHFGFNVMQPVTASGSISGPGDLTKTGNSTLTLTGANAYSGPTTVSAGRLVLSGSGSLASTPLLVIGGGATLDVSGLSSTFTLTDGQTLSGNGPAGSINGNVELNTGALMLNYTNGTPTLNVANGTLNFNSNAVTVTISGAQLAAGSYKLISTNTGGFVSGILPASVTVNGSGAIGGCNLRRTNSELYLVVANPSVAPTLGGISRTGLNRFLLSGTGEANQTCSVYASTNVAAPMASWWLVGSTNADAGGLINFLDTQATNAQQFYRFGP